jgi:hypothetical protein
LINKIRFIGGALLITKAIIRSINKAGTRCLVEMPLFSTASNPSPVTAKALVSITPGFFNNLFEGDVVFVTFEENALEKPIIIGKLFTGAVKENETPGGAGILDTLRVRTHAIIPCTTLYEYPPSIRNEYKDLETPKKTSDYIKWLEKLTKKLFNQLEDHFRCFKNWTQWQFKPENVEVDDGDIDTNYHIATALQYQDEGQECKICGSNCTKATCRTYLKLATDTKYPNN